jgi:hypothetical protein
VEESKTTTFVALLLHGETGKLIRRVEWLVDKSIASREIHIYALPEGGYLWRMGDNLQALDSSLNVIRGRMLNPLPKSQGYNIILPRAGYYFVVDQNVNGRDRIYDVIDWRTFETVEKMNATYFRITDIWNDRLLATDLFSAGVRRWLLEKKTGDTEWTIFGADLQRIQDAKYIYNGAIVVTCSLEDSGLFGPSFWFIIDNGKRSAPVIYGENNKERMGKIYPSLKSSTIAVGAYKLSGIRMFLDIGIAGTTWVDYWDAISQQRLIRIKDEKDELGGDSSPDGRRLVVLKKKKLEMYAIPETPQNKK